MIPYYLKKILSQLFVVESKQALILRKKGYTRFHSKGNILNTFEWN